MLIHRDVKDRRQLVRWLVAAVVFATCVGLGVWLGPHLRGVAGAGGAAPEQVPQASPPWFPRPRSQAELGQLQVQIAPADWQVLAAHRERAIAAKFLFQDANAVVPVTVRLGNETASGTARLKGDWLDHLDTEQWSLRFDLQTPIQGMRRFAVQHPKTRGYLMEWLVLRTARRMGALAPRAAFVQVSINDRPRGVYYLEEHPGKELLESQGRRDGPIVKFGEHALWSNHMQMGFLRVGALPAEFDRMYHIYDAQAEVIGTQRLVGLEALQARLARALHKAQDLQRLIVASSLAGNPVRRLQELTNLEGRTVDELFAAQRTGRVLAVLTFFQGFHGLFWNQLRLYHDPVLDRLEPIVNDTDANLMQRPGELVATAPEARWLRSSPAVVVSTYETLGRMTEPGWLEALLDELRPELEQAASAMARAGIDIPGFDLLDSLELLLRQQRERLHAFVRPLVAATFAARIGGMRLPTGEDLRTVDVDARATSEVPTRLSAFVLGNGRRVLARDALVGLVGQPDSQALVAHLPGGAILLPADGRPVRFRFAIDRRLAGLSEIAAIKRAIRQPLAGLPTASIEIAVEYRPAAETVERRTDLVLEEAPDPQAATSGRPLSPDLPTALQQHAFLEYDLQFGQLRVVPGTHDVVGDLLLPDTLPLHLGPGVELRMDPDAVLVAGALVVTGSGASPVRVGPKDAARGFAGVLVHGGAGGSRCEHLQVRGATAIGRGGWQATGGVTFLHAPVELLDCSIEGARGEDALNLIALHFSMQRCEFRGGPNDLFDGDFVDGEVIECRFADSGEDAIDVSGARVLVRNCTFTNIGDKALSVGEGSELTVQDSHVLGASIAMAAKDRSTAIAERLRVDAVENFVFASYIKKPEFGAATLRASELRWAGEGAARHLAQTGCTIVVDGVAVPPRDLDVDQLYRDRVLGK